MSCRVTIFHALRLTLLGALLAALLPWGAYARSFAADPAEAIFLTDATAPDAAFQTHPDDPKISAARRCRGPALLGSPCGPDLALAAIDPTIPDHLLTGPQDLDGTRLLPGRVVSGLTDPPRVR